MRWTRINISGISRDLFIRDNMAEKPTNWQDYGCRSCPKPCSGLPYYCSYSAESLSNLPFKFAPAKPLQAKTSHFAFGCYLLPFLSFPASKHLNPCGACSIFSFDVHIKMGHVWNFCIVEWGPWLLKSKKTFNNFKQATTLTAASLLAMFNKMHITSFAVPRANSNAFKDAFFLGIDIAQSPAPKTNS